MATTTKGIATFRGLGEAEIQEKLKAVRKQLWDTRQKLRAGTVQKTHEVRILKRDIAKMHTILNERRVPRESSGSQPEAALAASGSKRKA